jgi:hypothetical protein
VSPNVDDMAGSTRFDAGDSRNAQSRDEDAVPPVRIFSMAMDNFHVMGMVCYDAPELPDGLRQVNIVVAEVGKTWTLEPAGSQAALPDWGPFLDHTRRIMTALVEASGFEWAEATTP